MQDTLLFMCEVTLIAVYTGGTSKRVDECSQYNSGAQHRISQIDWCGI
jgi:hypothetical protein